MCLSTGKNYSPKSAFKQGKITKKNLFFETYEDSGNESTKHYSVKLILDGNVISKGRSTSKKKAEEIARKKKMEAIHRARLEKLKKEKAAKLAKEKAEREAKEAKEKAEREAKAAAERKALEEKKKEEER